MVRSRKRRFPFRWEKLFENEALLPFKTDLWIHIQKQIISKDKSLPVIKDILSSLQSIKCRDVFQGRLALDATYEIFLALQNLITTDHYSVNGKERLSRSLGVSINRVVGHLQEMESSLEGRPCGTIRSTLTYFEVDTDIADIRNEFAHGAIPNIIMMAEAIDKLLDLIVKIYWSAFDGDIKWPREISDLEEKVILNIKTILDMFRNHRDEPLSYESFLNSQSAKFLAPIINDDGEFFTKILLSSHCLIILNSGNEKTKVSKYIPPSYQIVAMRYIFQLVHLNWDIFDLARTVAEISFVDETKEITKIQYKYWAGWLIKKIATEKAVTEWEIKELGKWAVILNLDGCIEKIKKNYGLKDINFEEGLKNYPNVEEGINNDDDDIKISYTCGTWGI